MISNTEIQGLLPREIAKRLTPDVVDELNATFDDPEMMEHLKDNFFGLSNILEEGRFKVVDYMAAIKYTAYKAMGHNNISAYARVFPDRVIKLKADGRTNKDLSAYAAMYAKGQLVKMVMVQASMPSHILNMDVFQEAVNIQAKIMRNEDASFKVRSDAADSLMKHLKAPEAQEVNVKVSHNNVSLVQDLLDATSAYAAQQLSMMEQGILTTSDIGKARLSFDGEYTDVTDTRE